MSATVRRTTGKRSSYFATLRNASGTTRIDDMRGACQTRVFVFLQQSRIPAPPVLFVDIEQFKHFADFHSTFQQIELCH
jgi:hypothetical protein